MSNLPKLVMERLEDRVLFDAIPDASLTQPEAPAISEPQVGHHQDQQELATESTPIGVLVFDRSVMDTNRQIRRFQALYPRVAFEIHLLNDVESGVDQFDDVLQNLSEGTGSIHLVTEVGDDGFRLGDQWFNHQSLADAADRVAEWGNWLSTNPSGSEVQLWLVADNQSDISGSDDTPGLATLLESISGQIGKSLALQTLNWADDHAVIQPAVHYSEIIFVDAAIGGYEQLVEELLQNNDAEVVWLDSASDGVLQIEAALQGRTGISAIHIISHGADGMIQLGGSWLTAGNVDQHADTLASWGMALSENGDILIYGCDVAATEDGQAFLTQLSVWTGADVAASDDLTGAASLGGDWELEFTVGALETTSIFSHETAEQWYFVLSTATSGDDLLIGTAADDTIDGLAGNDVIHGDVNLIVNGDFASGTTGWSSTFGMEWWGYMANGSPATVDGNGLIELDEQGQIDAVYQDVSLTVGQTYTLAYSYAGRTGETDISNTFEVYVAGVLQATVVASNQTSWKSASYTFVASSATTRIEFRETTAGNDGGGPLLDNIQLNLANSHDVLLGGSGNDKIYGGAGNDLIEGGAGADILLGGAGTDTLSYAGSPAGVSVNLATGAVSGGDATGDIISDFENIIGSAFNDTLTGDAGNNVITGGGGNDTIDGGGGNDTAVFSGNWADYTITTGSDGQGTFYQLVDNTAGRDGTDKIYNIESVQFADGTRSVSALLNTAPTAVADTAIAVEAGGVNNGSTGTNPTGNVLNNDIEVDSGDTLTVVSVNAGMNAALADMVGWWRGDGNTDEVLGQSNGTLVNGATYGPGRNGLRIANGSGRRLHREDAGGRAGRRDHHRIRLARERRAARVALAGAARIAKGGRRRAGVRSSNGLRRQVHQWSDRLSLGRHRRPHRNEDCRKRIPQSQPRGAQSGCQRGRLLLGSSRHERTRPAGLGDHHARQ